MRNEFVKSLMSERRDFTDMTVFDVGANIGQSTMQFAGAFPGASIYSFKPSPDSFNILATNVASNLDVRCIQSALGKVDGQIQMLVRGTSTTNRVVKDSKDSSTIYVNINKGDTFCRENDIRRITYLKIDAEGHDLDVIMGFSKLLLGGKIEYVQVECGFSPDNRIHVSLEQFIAVFHAFGYGIHGIYDLERRLPRVGPMRSIGFGNAVFVRN